MLAKIRKFVAEPILLTTADEIKPEMGVPDAWVQVLRRQEDGIKSWVDLWVAYHNSLPGVHGFLKDKVRGVCLLLERAQPPSLLYVYSRGETDYFYRGRRALEGGVPDSKQGLWKRLPPHLQGFYLQLHDGWTQLASEAMGPQPMADIEFLSDQDWDLAPGDQNKLPFRLHDVITILSNGAGDYLGLDLGQGSGTAENCALVWWHEEPLQPDIGQNLWALMDAWISGQVEDADAAQ